MSKQIPSLRAAAAAEQMHVILEGVEPFRSSKAPFTIGPVKEKEKTDCDLLKGSWKR